jgi:hypothetical protein
VAASSGRAVKVRRHAVLVILDRQLVVTALARQPSSSAPLLPRLPHHQGLGRELGLPRCASPMSTCRTAGGLPGLAGQGLPRRNGLYGKPWHETRPSGRTGAGHGARGQRAHALPPPRTRSRPTGARAQSPQRRSAPPGLHLCARPRLPQGLRARLQQLADRIEGDRPLRLPRLHRFGPGHGSGPGREGGLGWRGKHTCCCTARPARCSSWARC